MPALLLAYSTLLVEAMFFQCLMLLWKMRLLVSCKKIGSCVCVMKAVEVLKSMSGDGRPPFCPLNLMYFVGLEKVRVGHCCEQQSP